MPDLITAIQAEHRRVLELADGILEGYWKWPVGERAGWRDIRALVALESRHEVSEARFLWPVVRDAMPEYAAVLADAKAQERDARRRLHRLRRAEGTAAGAGMVPVAMRALTIHIGLEEAQILPSLAARLSPTDSARLGHVYEAASAAAPTRPHPRVPAIPGLLGLVGPVAARADRIRDLLRLP